MHALQRAIINAGYEPRSYSGRGMYGNQCLGVTVDNLGDFIAGIIGEVVDYNRSDLMSAMQKLRQDSMGLSTILYFPGVPFTDPNKQCADCGRRRGHKHDCPATIPF